MALLFLEGIGPEGERIAMAAGAATGIEVGWDPDLNSATFDSPDQDDEGLQATVLDALAGVDSDWESHLRITD
jgi:hypothetical protein